MTYKQPDIPNPRPSGQRCHYHPGHPPWPGVLNYAGPYCDTCDRAHCDPVLHPELIGPQPAPKRNGTEQAATMTTQLTLRI